MADVVPIIIKRIKKGGHAHHGGSWKVAYADFVTAMMAFFLLLWLLNVTTPEQKKGIADYFTPTIGIKDAKGIGFTGGKSPSKKGTSSNDLTAPGLVIGQVMQGPVAKDPNDAKKSDPDSDSTANATKDKVGEQNNQESEDKTDSEDFKLAEQEIQQELERDPDLVKYKNAIQTEETPEGLKIDLIDDPKKAMFVEGGADLTSEGKKALDAMANIVSKTPNQVMIVGHTETTGTAVNARYSNWELSSDRANAARRALVTTQLETERVIKIVGMADHQLLMPKDPSNPRNRRITLVLLRGQYFRDPKTQSSTRSIISVPDAKLKKDEPPKDVVPAKLHETPSQPQESSLFKDPAPAAPAPDSSAPPATDNATPEQPATDAPQKEPQ